MSLRHILIFSVAAFGLVAPAGATAAPEPVDPLEVAKGGQLTDVAPHVSPGGRQFVTYSSLVPAPHTLNLIERVDGGAFSAPAVLTTAANVGPPSVSFAPDEGVHVAWGRSTSGNDAQQTFRPPGGTFAPAAPLTLCGRFLDSAASPTGQIAVACSQKPGGAPPDAYGLGIAPALGPVTVGETLSQQVYDSFIEPMVTWGRDGTLAVVAAYKLTTALPAPMNETERSRVTIRNAAAGVAATLDFDTLEPNELDFVGDPTVLADGTVALAATGTAGAKVFIRPPGPATSFASETLAGVGVIGLRSDAAQNLHAMSADPEPPTREYWASVKSSGGGGFGPPVPIPLAGTPDPYIPYDGFEVAPDGTEYALIRSDDATYATSRSPGDTTFQSPLRIGPAAANNPRAAVTPEGDLLVAWPVENGPGDYSAYLGGLDGHGPKVTVESFPVRGEPGVPLDFSARAVDSMGLRSVAWDFGDGTRVQSERTVHSFGPGSHPVTFTATDRAGNETVERRTVIVPGGGTGPEGSPRLRLVVPKKLRFRALARKGVRVKVRADRPVSIEAVIGTKRKGKLKPFRTKRVNRPKASHELRIKPKRAKLGRPRRMELAVEVTGAAASGDQATKTKKVRITP